MYEYINVGIGTKVAGIATCQIRCIRLGIWRILRICLQLKSEKVLDHREVLSISEVSSRLKGLRKNAADG